MPKAITYPELIDYVSFQNNELVFVLAIEKLLDEEEEIARRTHEGHEAPHFRGDD